MKELKDLFLPYELAIMCKEKGFDAPCFAFYQWIRLKKPSLYYEGDTGERFPFINSEWLKEYQSDCAAPLYQQVIQWLNTHHQILIQESFDGWRVFTNPHEPQLEKYSHTKGDAIKHALTLIQT